MPSRLKNVTHKAMDSYDTLARQRCEETEEEFLQFESVLIPTKGGRMVELYKYLYKLPARKLAVIGVDGEEVVVERYGESYFLEAKIAAYDEDMLGCTERFVIDFVSPKLANTYFEMTELEY